jgi:poly-beta-hydroxybutyrate-responsive repressor
MSTDGALPRNFLRPCLLLLLRERPAHGYELIEQLQAFGYSGDDPGGVYRSLRALEKDGYVRSGWEQSDAGPQRRIYELTREGMEQLHAQAKALSSTQDALGVFLSRYSEFVALEPGERRRRAASIRS